MQAVIDGKSFKSHCASAKVGKTDFALAIQTLKYKDTIEKLFLRTNISAEGLDVNKGILLVMAYEMLFGIMKISGGGAVKKRLMEHKDELMKNKDKLMMEEGASTSNDLLSESIKMHENMQKYVRVNEIKVPLADSLIELQKISPLAEFDEHIPSLVSVAADVSGLGDHPWVRDGRLIIQDKASCMPSQILFDTWVTRKGDCIDACAAPGNKTSHLASLIITYQQQNNKQSAKQNAKQHPKAKAKAKTVTYNIHAFDKDLRRCDLLRSRLQQAGADTIVQCYNQDFLSLDTTSPVYQNVRCILLDPSCSGSGVKRAIERAIDATPDDHARIAKLRSFQIAALKKAMSFPNVEAITYSTCSVYVEENESVVAEILEACNKGVGEGGVAQVTGVVQAEEEAWNWKLARPRRFHNWVRRGWPHPGLTSEQQQCLIRCDPSDGLNGFFVALFVKSRVNSKNGSLVGPLHPPAATSSSTSSPSTPNGEEEGRREPTAGPAEVGDGERVQKEISCDVTQGDNQRHVSQLLLGQHSKARKRRRPSLSDHQHPGPLPHPDFDTHSISSSPSPSLSSISASLSSSYDEESVGATVGGTGTLKRRGGSGKRVRLRSVSAKRLVV